MGKRVYEDIKTTEKILLIIKKEKKYSFFFSLRHATVSFESVLKVKGLNWRRPVK